MRPLSFLGRLHLLWCGPLPMPCPMTRASASGWGAGCHPARINATCAARLARACARCGLPDFAGPVPCAGRAHLLALVSGALRLGRLSLTWCGSLVATACPVA